jgi:hypothetical protein
VSFVHKLVSMSDGDRDRLLDRFWDEISDGLDVHPDFAERLPVDAAADVTVTLEWLAAAQSSPQHRVRHSTEFLAAISRLLRAFPARADR